MPDAGSPRHLVLSSADSGSRLDVVLATHLTDLSRSRIQQLLRSGHIVVNGRPAKAGLIVTEGMTVEIAQPPVETAAPRAEALPLTILHEDADVVVIDKPAGMVVHPAAGHAEGTLVNALLHHLKGLSAIGGVDRPGIVHRLDRGTSGVMVVARNDRAHRELTRQFQERQVGKEYLALVWGRPRPGAVFDNPIGRDPRHRKRMSSRARHSRSAVTTVLEARPLQGVSLLRLAIGTGRTHQIRVHLSEAGFPVVGDELYGGVRKRLPAEVAAVERLDRPFLHAARLTFTHPCSGVEMSFESPLAPDLAAVLEALERVSAGRR
jgi:23S rRNA pseudouridine1911/1915/1917 synthase